MLPSASSSCAPPLDAFVPPQHHANPYAASPPPTASAALLQSPALSDFRAASEYSSSSSSGGSAGERGGSVSSGSGSEHHHAHHRAPDAHYAAFSVYGVEGVRVKTEYSELGNVFGPQGFGKRVEGREDAESRGGTRPL